MSKLHIVTTLQKRKKAECIFTFLSSIPVFDFKRENLILSAGYKNHFQLKKRKKTKSFFNPTSELIEKKSTVEC